MVLFWPEHHGLQCLGGQPFKHPLERGMQRMVLISQSSTASLEKACMEPSFTHDLLVPLRMHKGLQDVGHCQLEVQRMLKWKKNNMQLQKGQTEETLMQNNQRETTLGNQYTKCTVLSCVCTLQGQWTPASPSFLKIKGRRLRETNEVKLTQNDFYQTFPT